MVGILVGFELCQDLGRHIVFGARARQLRQQGAVSQAALDAAETASDVAAARLQLSRVALANTTLRAPIDGTVIRKIRDMSTTYPGRRE